MTWKTTAPIRRAVELKPKSQPVGSEDSLVTSYYTAYGKLIKTITPLKFKIPLQAVELANSKTVVNPIPFHQFDGKSQKWIMQYGDFTGNITSEPVALPLDDYTDFFLFFFEDVGNMGMSSTPGITAPYTNEIEIQLPEEYKDANLIKDKKADFLIDGEPVYRTRIINEEEGIYQVPLVELMPWKLEENGYEKNRKNLNVFWFNGDDYITYDIPKGQVSHELSDYKNTPGMGINGNSVYTRLPWDGIRINPKALDIEFEIFWDLEDIVELYDNNTESDLTDDILVLADKFWERIHINVRQYDKDGVELP